MTTAEALRRAVVTAIERDKALLDAAGTVHVVRFTVKPRGDGYRVSTTVETAESEV